ncbi:hypothetical protein L7F22_049683 [Adiantum nelumboides]|nr:hypothetical protein [Adiantum nelumboides]
MQVSKCIEMQKVTNWKLVIKENDAAVVAAAELSLSGVRRYLMPLDMNVGQFVFDVIRKRIRLEAEKAIFIFVNNVLPPTAALMPSIYEEHKDQDGFLKRFTSLGLHPSSGLLLGRSLALAIVGTLVGTETLLSLGLGLDGRCPSLAIAAASSVQARISEEEAEVVGKSKNGMPNSLLPDDQEIEEWNLGSESDPKMIKINKLLKKELEDKA